MSTATLDPVVANANRVGELMAKLRASPYIPIEPSRKQWLFILDERKEVLYGGAAGPGKSYALLAAALLHVDQPGYHALILRRTYGDLSLPGALMDVAEEWLSGTDARPVNGGRTWIFPSGATLTFSYLAIEKHKYRYSGAAFAFIGFDELTQFTSTQYRFMFSRVRQSKTAAVKAPLRVRSTSNPGGSGHEWVKARFVDAHRLLTRAFIPGLMTDNPHLDVAAYREMLAELDPVTRAQLEHGDWEIRPAGNFFRATGFILVPPAVLGQRALRVRAWDLAGTEDGGDWTAGCLLAYDQAEMRWRIEHVVRRQEAPDDLERTLQSTAARDGRLVPILIEQEPGSAAKFAMRDLRRRVLAGYTVKAVNPSGSKMERARLPASLIANGDMDLVRGDWNADFKDELVAFPSGDHDDQVDALSYAAHYIAALIAIEHPAKAATGSKDAAAGRPKRLAQSKARISR